MADLMSILSTSYKAAGVSTPSKTKYVAVDPTLYKGTWTGKYPDGKTFSLAISNVDGFRAQVRYQSGSTTQYQQVLIKDSSFRFGNTKFTLTNIGKAQIKNVVTDPATGSTYLDTAQATLDA
ncbi:hypothetical protein QA640_16020 [Bradyrhizobium sp. CB82]|uniref:hypothetical protein n=1 Tax=Bradyrhizobium sp. CB82 TaxID=3039159 RepID=UPI0024B283AA|nr:hypothetical protein [Bradyrhizobium sp. CB82]WFU43811.1 hypothetical protein QA640_16020 [Bradyrhizobium sp. CB82]